jgi:DNA-binding NarL/FixJ family response regulator
MPATDWTTAPVRILIADDHAMVRAGLRMLIEQEPHLHVVGEAGDVAAVVGLAESHQPDVVLLDLDMAGRSGLEVLPDVLSVARQARVLILTGMRDPAAHVDAVRRGALGVLLKDQAASVLIKAIEKVQAGEAWLDRTVMGNVIEELQAKNKPLPNSEEAKIATLTQREREVLDLVSQGLKNHEIADRLFVSDHTVRHHVGALYAKLDVSDRLELILYAYRHRLAKPPGT